MEKANIKLPDSVQILNEEKRLSCRDCAEVRALHVLIDERLNTYDKQQEANEKSSKWRMWIVGTIISVLLTANLFLLNIIRVEIKTIKANNFTYQQFMFQNQNIDKKLNWLVTQEQRLYYGLNKVEEKVGLEKTAFPDYLGNVL